MRRWFVVGTESITAEQEKSFVDYIQSTRMGWWHWIPNFWLCTGDDAPNCDVIRDKFLTIAPGKDIIVVEVNPITWAAYGPKSDKRDMFPWLNSTWSPPEAKS